MQTHEIVYMLTMPTHYLQIFNHYPKTFQLI